MIIVAVDGLEIKLVEKWKLKNLMQVKYGSYPVDTNYNSVQLWSSFLTGLDPSNFEKFFVVRPWNLHNKKIPSFLKKIGRRLIPLRAPSVKGKYKTIFDEVKPSLPYNVFIYNEEPKQLKLRYKYGLLKTTSYPIKERRRIAWKWIKWNKYTMNKFINLIENKPNILAMTHIYATDYIGHILYGSLQMRYIYHLIDEYIGELNRRFKRNILVVSDHGMEDGIHTNHGFYSLNIQTDWRPTDITDFCPKISEWCLEHRN